MCTSENETHERVKVLDQITNVKIGIQTAQGTCALCGEEGEVVRVIAIVYYPGRDQYGRVGTMQSQWAQDFCSWCINQFFGTKEDEVGKSYL